MSYSWVSIYAATGITRPKFDVGAMNSLAQGYAETAAGMAGALAGANAAKAAVVHGNEGTAADAFADQVSAGIIEHLAEVTTAAARTATAYRSAALAALTTRLSMDAVELIHRQMVGVAALKRDTNTTIHIMQQARAALLTLETSGAAQVTAAFANLDLPTPLFDPTRDLSPTERNLFFGVLDDGIAGDWMNLALSDPEAAMALLQRLADTYADLYDIPRIELKYLDAPPGKPFDGRYYFFFGPHIEFDRDLLINPDMLNAVIHEMEHARQDHGMNERDRKWPHLNVSDVGGGMTPDEAERWRELDSDEVRAKGGEDTREGKRPRPREVGARQAARDFINKMTYDDYQSFK